jgi:hypothetical protein
MVVVFHDAHSKGSNEDAMRKNYIEYGRVLESLIAEINPGTIGPKSPLVAV